MSAITPENEIAAEEFTPAAELDTDTHTDIATDLDTELDGLEADFADAADADDADDDFDDDADEIDALDEDDEDDDEDEAAETAGSAPVAFTELGLPEELVKKLADSGVHNTFPIQAATIPDALAGRHVLGKARTGSGKTLAFGLAALANLKGKRARKGKPLALVLVPTRELAMQVSDALQPYGFAVGADIAAVYGGAPMYKQVFSLRRGVELLVATPGRLTDLIEQEECDLSEVEIAILDEADQMADMGFMPIVTELLSQTDPAGQRLLFSATLDGAVDELVQKYMTDPVLHSVTPDDDDQAQMDHHLLIVEPADKAMVTAEIAARHTPGGQDGRRTILFARTKLGADRIAEKIREAGVSALALHGGMTQRARTKTLADFKDGRVPVLVATDVAARGIHVDGIDLVLHVDPAGDPKDYLHRAGRTARAGESGTVVTLVLPKQRKSTMRLLETAGVEAELTKVTPSSEALRELTGGRPVAEYVAEADAYHSARRAARDARMGDDRREGRDGFRGGREGGFRGGREGFRQDRDRFDRGHRGGFGGDRSGSGSGSGFGGERRSFGDRDTNRGGFDRDNRGGERRSFGDRDTNRGGFDRDKRGSFGGDRSGSGSGFGGGGERRSFGDRDTNRGGAEGRSFGDRDNRGGFSRDNRGGAEGRSFDRDNRGGERRSFGDRDTNRGGFDRANRGGGERRPFGDRDNRGGERRSFGDRDTNRDTNRGGFDRDNRGGGERRPFDRNGSQTQGRSFDRDNRGGGERRPFDRNGSQPQGRSFDRDNRGGGERRPFDRNGSQTQGRSFDRDNRGGDRNGSQNRGFGQRGGFDRDNREGGERRTFGERTAFGRPRGGYSNGDQRDDNRPTRDRRW
ncbi:superfamily II DNA/RNA helicase [Catenulispora sp. MAP12-49]|uniref:DEAD/DEAH box helicase n=1 Tax=Catenulispora sp. MAP12-49 TaxID=3156302 RepID=UPI0035163887